MTLRAPRGTRRRARAHLTKVTGVVAVIATMTLAGCGGPSASQATRTLVGTFEIQAGHCSSAHGAPSGSFMVIVDSAGSKTVPNPAGGCANKYYTLLTPGTQKGITTGAFQEDPTPTFDAHNDSLADAIIKPVPFQGIRLGMATNPVDVQDAPSGAAVFAAPRATVQGTKLHVDLRSLNITYGGPPNATCLSSSGYGCWNLGSKNAAGSYDPATHQYALEWFVGETFTPSGDSMVIRLVGTFVPEKKARS
jgi:hypothetical protein